MPTKALLATIAATIILTGGGILLATKTAKGAGVVGKNEQTTAFSDHATFDWGVIAYDSAPATHSFPIKNDGTEPLKVANIKTSCTCTTARLVTAEGTSRKYGMHQKSNWVGIIQPGETAQLEIEFDQKFHGPSGTGPVQRMVSLETSDPARSYMEFSLTGTVVK